MITNLKPYAAYKDSGVPWLGQVPAHWEVRAVRHVTRPVKGRQPKALYSEDEAPAGAQPYLTMEYLRRHKGTAKVYCALSDGLVTAAAGDVLLLWDGANAGEFFIAKDGVVSSTVALLSTDEHDRRYLYFMLKQCEPWLRALSTGMGIPHVDGRILKQMQICLPPHAEQAAIVRFLDWADRRMRRYIRAKQKLIKLLEEYRKALIHQVVTGQIDVCTGKPYPAYKNSSVEWLGKVPGHWEVQKLKRLGEVKIGLTYAPSDVTGDDGTLVLRASNIRDGAIVSADDVFVSKEVPQSLRVAEGDILICVRSGSRSLVGKVAIIPPSFSGVTFGAFMSLLRSSLNPFIYWVFNSNMLTSVMAQFQTSTINQLTQNDLRNLDIPLPPLPEQTTIAAYLDAQTAKIDAAIASARREVELLREYRERLIVDVVTGKVDVREVAAQLPEEPPEEEAELMDADEIAEGEATDNDAAAEALSEEEVEP